MRQSLEHPPGSPKARSWLLLEDVGLNSVVTQGCPGPSRRSIEERTGVGSSVRTEPNDLDPVALVLSANWPAHYCNANQIAIYLRSEAESVALHPFVVPVMLLDELIGFSQLDVS